jgi:hypothetical protein
MMMPGKLVAGGLSKAAGAVGAPTEGFELAPRAVRTGLAALGNGIIGAIDGATGYNLSNQERIDRAKWEGGLSAILGAGTEAVLGTIGAKFAKGNTPAKGVDTAARMAEAEPFGLAGESGLTRGQATGNVGQQTFEQKALRGGLGQNVQATVADRATNQGKAIANARQSIL